MQRKASPFGSPTSETENWTWTGALPTADARFSGIAFLKTTEILPL